MFQLINTYKKYDPAAKSKLEILLFYPGIKAIAIHRVAHFFYQARIPLLPRFLSEIARWMTGIEIHPGARLGKNIVIDHGMGVVIGETAIVEDGVIIYQGVTLGGTSLAAVKRHPTVQKDVVIGAGAKVLGNIVIGTGSRVGANSVVIETVPPGTTVVGIPAKVVMKKGIQSGEELSHDFII